jgi:hypothetical protein
VLDFLVMHTALDGIISSRSDCAGACLGSSCQQQPQLSMLFVQQPQQQAAQRAVAGGAGLARSSVRAGQQQRTRAAPADSLTVSIAALKLTVGPHSTSMLLQLAACLSAGLPAARDAHVSAADAAGGLQQAEQQQHRQQPATRRVRMVVHVQLAMCHAAINMERMLLPGSVAGSGGHHGQQLQTKGLLSLLLLDVGSTARVVPDASPDTMAGRPGASSSSAAAAAAAVAGPSSAGDPGPTTAGSRPGTHVSCFMAHLGLQDLCAAVEQRHVLSGAGAPYAPSTVSCRGAECVCVMGLRSVCWPISLTSVAGYPLSRRRMVALPGQRHARSTTQPAWWQRACTCRHLLQRRRPGTPHTWCWRCTSRVWCSCGAS